MFRLRKYQSDGIELIRDEIRSGKTKIILWSMTGAGKGLIMSEINRLNVFNGRRVLNVMRRRSLITQTKNNFKKYHGLNSSIIMGSEKGFNPGANIQVGSIDTLQRRYKKGKLDFLLDYDTILIDECHDTTSKTYRDFLDWLDKNGAPKIFIGLTATPFMVGKKCHDYWESVVKPIEAHELRDEGYLVRDKIYAPSKIDLSGLRKAQGDYHAGDLFDAVSEMSVIGDVVKSYKKYGESRPAILFAVNVSHSKLMVEAFRVNGIPAAHYDADSSKEDREKGINDLKTGKIKVLCNVMIFSTGVDIPFAEVGIMARPTMSEILDIQQRGRLLRPYKICGKCGAEYGGEKNCFICGHGSPRYEKKEAIFLDHANNTDRHGLTYKVRQAYLEAPEKVRKTKFTIGHEVNIKQCPECFLYLEQKAKICDGCEHEFKTKERTIKTEDGELVLLDAGAYEKKLREKIEIRWAYHNKQVRYKGGNAYDLIFKDFGPEVFDYISFPPSKKKELQKGLILQNAKSFFGA